MPKPVVLIVDDEPANASTFRRAFRKELEVRVAGSATDALDVLSREPIDCIISDFTMPAINGLDLLRACAERWPRVRRIMSSGHTVLPAGVHEVAEVVIEKPWHRAELLGAIDRLVGPRNALAALRGTT